MKKLLTESELEQHYDFYHDECGIEHPVSFEEWKREHADDLNALFNGI
jgi:hypothetical protein